jgi:hypothetical protein
MKFKRFLPFFVVTIVWSIYVGLTHGPIFAFGIAITTIATAYIQPIIAIHNTSPNFSQKRFNAFVVVWALLMCAQAFFYFYAKELSASLYFDL